MIDPSNQSVFLFQNDPKNPVWNDPKNPVTNSCQDKKGDLINLDRRLGTLLILFKLPTKMSTLIILCARLGSVLKSPWTIKFVFLCTFLHPNLCLSYSNSDNNLKNLIFSSSHWSSQKSQSPQQEVQLFANYCSNLLNDHLITVASEQELNPKPFGEY